MNEKRTRAIGRRIVRAAGALVLAFSSLVAGGHAASAFTTCSGPSCSVTPQDDNYTTMFDTPLTVAAPGVLTNDSGPDGTHVMVDDSDSTSWNGATVTLRSTGSFTYTPDPTTPYSGIDQFDYAVIDRLGNEDFATVYIQVNPIVGTDTVYTHVNQVLTVPAPGVYAHDAGLDNSFAPDYDATSVHGGTVVVNDDGSFQYTPPSPLFSGVDSFTYSQWDLDFDNEYTGTVSVYVDSTPPTVSLAALATVTPSTKVHVSWSGADALSGIAGYDVDQTGATWNGDYSAASAFMTATTSTSVDKIGTYGRTYCFTARAHDKAANTSAWTARRCTSIPLKSTQLTYSSGWATEANSVYFGAVAVRTSTYGARLTRTSIKAKQAWLLVTKCSFCGVVTVRWNGVTVANVNLYSPTTKRQQAVSVLSLGAPQLGTLTATLASHGKSAIIEGLAVYRG